MADDYEEVSEEEVSEEEEDDSETERSLLALDVPENESIEAFLGLYPKSDFKHVSRDTEHKAPALLHRRLGRADLASTVKFDVGKFLRATDIANLSLASTSTRSNMDNSENRRCASRSAGGILCVQHLFLQNPFNDSGLCASFCGQNRRLVLRNLIRFFVNDVVVGDFATKTAVQSHQRSRLRHGHRGVSKPKSKSRSKSKWSQTKSGVLPLSTTRASFRLRQIFTPGLWAQCSKEGTWWIRTEAMGNRGEEGYFRLSPTMDIADIISRTSSLFENVEQASSAQEPVLQEKVYMNLEWRLENLNQRGLFQQDEMVPVRLFCGRHALVPKRFHVYGTSVTELVCYGVII